MFHPVKFQQFSFNTIQRIACRDDSSCLEYLQLRKPLIFSLVMGLTLFMSFTTDAHAGDQRWLTLTNTDRAIVDRIAADLYVSRIREAQWRAMQQGRHPQQSVPHWTVLSAADKAGYRRQAMDILGAQFQHIPYQAHGQIGRGI